MKQKQIVNSCETIRYGEPKRHATQTKIHEKHIGLHRHSNRVSKKHEVVPRRAGTHELRARRVRTRAALLYVDHGVVGAMPQGTVAGVVCVVVGVLAQEVFASVGL